MNKDTADRFISMFASPAYLVRVKDTSILSVNDAGTQFAPNACVGSNFGLTVCGLSRSCINCSRSLCSFIQHKTFEFSLDGDPVYLSLWAGGEADNGIVFLDEIDISKGLINFAENIDSYVNVLMVYRNVGCEKLDLIRSLYEEKDYENFRIEVHGIKGTSYVIGADRLGDSFKEMEYASRDYLESLDESSLSIISENLDKYLSSYAVLVDKLSLLADSMTDKNSIEILEDEFDQLVTEAISNLGSYELEEAEEILLKLEQASLPDDRRMVLAKALSEYRNFDYDKCSYYLDKLQKK